VTIIHRKQLHEDETKRQDVRVHYQVTVLLYMKTRTFK